MHRLRPPRNHRRSDEVGNGTKAPRCLRSLGWPAVDPSGAPTRLSVFAWPLVRPFSARFSDTRITLHIHLSASALRQFGITAKVTAPWALRPVPADEAGLRIDQRHRGYLKSPRHQRRGFNLTSTLA